MGDAGMGKSRLIYEFRRRLSGEPHAWFEGRCASYGSSNAFQMIVDGLRRYFRIEDQDDDARASGKLAEGVRSHGEDLEWTLPLLRQLLSLPVDDERILLLDAVTRRSETFHALWALFQRISEKAPLVFVAEDLHWIDNASEDFLGYMGDSVPTGRVLLLFTHRPGYQHPFGDRSYHVRVALRVLSEDETAQIAGSLLETLEIPGALRQLIARKAEGNPFFIEEVTKSLVEQDVLRLENGRLALTRDISDINIPDSIQDLLMARIDRLAEEPKRAIQIASIIGREFALRLLERISEVGDRLEGVIQDLRALELIYEKSAHPELAFMFKHALTHDVAYQSVLVKRRKTLHAIVGIAIEDLYRDRLAEHYDALAHHFERAEEWDRALHYHELAAQKSVDAFANHAAAEHFHRAIDIAGRLGDAVPRDRRRLLEEGYATVCFYTSRFKEAAEANTRAAEFSETPEDEARNCADAAHNHFWAHAYEAGTQSIERALTIVRGKKMPAIEAYALGMKGFTVAVQTGEMDTYESLITRARELAQVADDEVINALIEYLLAEHSEWTGSYRKAITCAETALEAGRRFRLPHLIIWPAWFIGKAYTCLGDYPRALQHLKDGLALTERIGDRAWRTRLLNTTGWCMAELGDIPAARAFNEQAAKLAHEIGDDEIIANAEINLAVNHLALGDLDEARGFLEPIREGLERRQVFMRWRYGLHLQDALGRLALARGEPERTLAMTEPEAGAARHHRAPKIEARALELRGRALVTMDRREEGAEALHGAITAAETIGYPPVIWRAKSLLAELARRKGKSAEAERLAAEARSLVESLAGAIPEKELQRTFGALGERLVTDPLRAYR